VPTINISGQPPQGPQGGPQGYHSSSWDSMRSKYGDALTNLESRSKDPQTPSMQSSFGRAVDRFEQAARRLEQRFGGADAGFASRVQNLRTGMGTPEGAFKVSQILRQGNIAQGSAIRGGLTGQYQTGKISEELRRIEATLEKQLKLESNPSALAALQRQKDAVYIAKSRISASGPPGALGGVLRGAGALAGAEWASRLGVYGAAAGAVAGTAYEIAKAPYTANQKLAGMYAVGQQYRDFEVSQRRLGAAGGFAGRDLEALTLSHSNLPGQGLPQELRTFGMSPEDVTRYAGAYGVPQRSARGTLDVAEQARLASLAPGMGLSEESAAKMAGQARSMTFGSFSTAEYFTRLQKVMGMATTQGLDSSRLASSWSGFLQTAASSSASVNTGSLADFFSRGVGSGAPSMRAGEGQADILTGFNQSMASLGTSGNMAGNVVMSSFLGKNGNPQSEESLRKSFGMSKKDWDQLVSTPTGQRALSNYIGAAKAGNGMVAQQALGVLISGHPELEDRILSGGGFVVPDYLKDTVRTNVFGGSYLNQTAYGSTQAGQGSSLGGMAPMPGTPLFEKIKSAADRNGVPLDVLMATVSKESGFNPSARARGSSATGLGQVTAGTAAQFGYSQSDMLDPDKNLDATAKYLAEQLRATGGNADQAYQRFHYGPGSGVFNQEDNAVFETRRQQYSNLADTTDAQGRTATGQTASLSASRYADANLSPVADAIVASFRGASQAVDGLTTSANGAAAALAKIAGTHQLGFSIPSKAPATGSYPFDIPGGSSAIK
jgi:hypothetical protein